MKYFHPIKDIRVEKCQHHRLQEDEIMKKLSKDLSHDDKTKYEMIEGFNLEEIMEVVSSILPR